MSSKKLTPKWNGSKEGYIDDNGDWAIDPVFDEADFFGDGIARVRVEDKWGWIDTNGGWVIKPRFKDARNFVEDRAAVKVYGEKWSYIDRDGKRITMSTFDSARDFSYGFAAVEVKDEWGFINRDGEMVIKPWLEEVGAFTPTGLYAKATLDGAEGWIDTTGTWHKELPKK